MSCRFDVRGALYDLREATTSGPEQDMTDAEKKTEELCEEERYLALYHDEEQYKLELGQYS